MYIITASGEKFKYGDNENLLCRNFWENPANARCHVTKSKKFV